LTPPFRPSPLSDRSVVQSTQFHALRPFTPGLLVASTRTNLPRFSPFMLPLPQVPECPHESVLVAPVSVQQHTTVSPRRTDSFLLSKCLDASDPTIPGPFHQVPLSRICLSIFSFFLSLLPFPAKVFFFVTLFRFPPSSSHPTLVFFPVPLGHLELFRSFSPLYLYSLLTSFAL